MCHMVNFCVICDKLRAYTIPWVAVQQQPTVINANNKLIVWRYFCYLSKNKLDCIPISGLSIRKSKKG